MKTLRNIFVGTWVLLGMTSWAPAGIEQECLQAKKLVAYGELNESAQKLIKIHDDVRNGMYEIIQRHSPHSEVLVEPTNCNDTIQRRGRTFESPIFISAWAEGSLNCVMWGTLTEYIELRSRTMGEAIDGCFAFYGYHDEVDRFYGFRFCRGDRKADMEKELKKFLTKKICKTSLQECAEWWNENFCRTASKLLDTYTQKLSQNPAEFTLDDTHYFLMTYKVYVESDGGSNGQLMFSQENFKETRPAVHVALARLLLHPQAEVQAKELVLTALANWDNPVYQNLGKVGNVDIHPIGYYQVEIRFLDQATHVECENNYTDDVQAIEKPIRIIQRAKVEWYDAYQSTLKSWKRQFQQLLRSQSQKNAKYNIFARQHDNLVY